MTAHSPIYIRPTQVAELYGIHRSTLYRWTRAGLIKIHKRGTSSFVRAADLAALIEGEEVESAP